MSNNKNDKKPDLSNEKNLDSEEIIDESLDEPKSKDSLNKKTNESNEKKDSTEEIEEPKKDFEELYIRTQAEMKNIINRFKKEKQSLLKYESEKIVSELIPVIDNLERASEVEVTNSESIKIKDGVDMVLKSFNNILKDNGVSSFGKEGEEFDPNFYQAVQTEKTDNQNDIDKIYKVLQKGYKLNDKLIRPAMVVVYK